MSNDLSVFDQRTAPSGEESRLGHSRHRGQEVDATAPGGQGATLACDVDAFVPTNRSVLKEFILVPGGSGFCTGAGLMTACASIGTEIGCLSDSKLTAMLLLMLAGSALGAMWVGMTSSIATLLAGGLP